MDVSLFDCIFHFLPSSFTLLSSDIFLLYCGENVINSGHRLTQTFVHFSINNNNLNSQMLGRYVLYCELNKASQAIQSPRTVPFFLLVSLLDGYSFPNVLVKGIVAFKH